MTKLAHFGSGAFNFVIGEAAGAAASSYLLTGGTLKAFGILEARRGTFTQTGGEALFTGSQGIQFDDGAGSSFAFSLVGGILRTEGLAGLEGSDSIDFLASSTATLLVNNGNLTVDEAATLITSGYITRNQAPARIADFDIDVVMVLDVDYTRIRTSETIFTDGFEF